MTVNTFARWLLSSNDNNLHATSNQILPDITPSRMPPVVEFSVYPETAFLDVILRSPADGGRRRIS